MAVGARVRRLRPRAQDPARRGRRRSGHVSGLLEARRAQLAGLRALRRTAPAAGSRSRRSQQGDLPALLPPRPTDRNLRRVRPHRPGWRAPAPAVARSSAAPAPSARGARRGSAGAAARSSRSPPAKARTVPRICALAATPRRRAGSAAAAASSRRSISAGATAPRICACAATAPRSRAAASANETSRAPTPTATSRSARRASPGASTSAQAAANSGRSRRAARSARSATAASGGGCAPRPPASAAASTGARLCTTGAEVLCGDCAAIPQTRVCGRCGIEDITYDRGRCPACSLHARLEQWRSDGPPEVIARLEPHLTTLAAVTESAVGAAVAGQAGRAHAR